VSDNLQPTSGFAGRGPFAHGLKRLSAFVAIASSLTLLALSVVWAPAGWAVDVRVAQLEVKFFRHDYPNDNPRQRLERLEKMVFGVARTGSDRERLSRLLSAVPSLDSEPSPERIPAVRNIASQKTSPAQASGAREPKLGTADYTPPASSKYPAVSAMEKRLFGTDYSAEHITSRLDRLEKRMYGRTFAASHLGDRVDRLRDKTGVDIATQIPQSYLPALDDDEKPRSQVANGVWTEPVLPPQARPPAAARNQRPANNRWSPAQSRWQPSSQDATFTLFPPRLSPPISVDAGAGIEEYTYDGSPDHRRRQATRGYARAWGGSGGLYSSPRQRQAQRWADGSIAQRNGRSPAYGTLDDYVRAQRRQQRRQMSVPPLAPPIAQGYGRVPLHPCGAYGVAPQIALRSAPPYMAPPRPTYSSPLPVALIPHVTALELRQFGIAYPWDPLPLRIGRLEAAMIPSERSRTDMPLPDRLERLVRLLPYGRWGGPLMADRYR